MRRIFSPVFLEAFVLTFLAEWGDRSQVKSNRVLSTLPRHITASPNCLHMKFFASTVLQQSIREMVMGSGRVLATCIKSYVTHKRKGQRVIILWDETIVTRTRLRYSCLTRVLPCADCHNRACGINGRGGCYYGGHLWAFLVYRSGGAGRQTPGHSCG